MIFPPLRLLPKQWHYLPCYYVYDDNDDYASHSLPRRRLRRHCPYLVVEARKVSGS